MKSLLDVPLQLWKRNILKSFTQPGGWVRIIFVFGMGLNSPNVRYIYHWGPPDLEEIGHGGCDGATAKCILYFSPRDSCAKHHVTAGMKSYCGNTVECRRILLMQQSMRKSWKHQPIIISAVMYMYVHTLCACCICACMKLYLLMTYTVNMTLCIP
jgi:hypothetical protein